MIANGYFCLQNTNVVNSTFASSACLGVKGSYAASRRKLKKLKDDCYAG